MNKEYLKQLEAFEAAEDNKIRTQRQYDRALNAFYNACDHNKSEAWKEVEKTLEAYRVAIGRFAKITKPRHDLGSVKIEG
jgi:hypothetical protein